MKSYIKIYGPPVFNAIKILEKIAVDMPQICIMDTLINNSPIIYGSGDYTQDARISTSDYFGEFSDISVERCNTIISISGEELGDNDFYFEWFKKPTIDELNDLIKRIDKALEPIGVKYTITTK